MKLYNISEAAKILNVSSGLLRHYEKLGLIVPVREENGYRCFSISDIDMLLGIRRFRNMGFPLEDMELLIDKGDYAQVREHYHRRIDSLESEIEEKRRVLDALKNLSSEIDGVGENEGRFEETLSPEVLRIDSRENDSFHLDEITEETLRWVDQMPQVSISPLFPLPSVLTGRKDVKFGFVAPYGLAKEMKLDKTENTAYFPPVPCISTILFSAGEERIHAGKLAPVLAYLQDNRYEPAGDPWGITIGNYNEAGRHKRFHRIYFPVRKK